MTEKGGNIIIPQAAPEQQQKTNPIMDTVYTGFMNQVGNANLIQWQLDGKDVLEEIEHKLKGEVWGGTDSKGNEIYKPKGVRLMNDEGIGAVLTLISARLSKLVILSNLEDDDIRKMQLAFSKDLIGLFYVKYKDFAIAVPYLSSIVNFIEDLVYATLKRALKGGERDFLKMTERLRIESGSDKPNKGIGGFMDNVFGKKN